MGSEYPRRALRLRAIYPSLPRSEYIAVKTSVSSQETSLEVGRKLINVADHEQRQIREAPTSPLENVIDVLGTRGPHTWEKHSR